MNKRINAKLFITLFLLSNVVYGIMILWSIPKLIEFSGGLRPFDMRPMGYTFEEALALLNGLGSEGIDFYKNWQLVLDLIYPLGFILTYSVGNLWIYTEINKWAILGQLGAYFSLLAGVADYVENSYIYSILSSFPNLSEKDVTIGSNATLIKSFSTTVSLSVFTLGLVIYVGILLFKRKRS